MRGVVECRSGLPVKGRPEGLFHALELDATALWADELDKDAGDEIVGRGGPWIAQDIGLMDVERDAVGLARAWARAMAVGANSSAVTERPFCAM